MTPMVYDCWTEPGRCHNKAGYLEVSRCTYGEGLGHRAVFLAVYGYLPPVVRHKCDNPPCFNPAHLLPGTQKDNVRDTVERGRNTPPPSNKRNTGMPDQRIDPLAYKREAYRRQKEGTWIYRN